MRQQDSFIDTDLSTLWMPLDGLIQLWVAFGNEASDVPQTADVLHATSKAFAALAEERIAFRHYTIAHTQPQQQLPSQFRERASTVDTERPGEPALRAQSSPIEALQQAATHWLEVAGYLEHYATHWCQEDEALQHDLRVLMVHALSQRLRVWTIAQHLLQEEVTDYRKHYGIITDLIDGESEDDAGTEGKERW